MKASRAAARQAQAFEALEARMANVEAILTAFIGTLPAKQRNAIEAALTAPEPEPEPVVEVDDGEDSGEMEQAGEEDE